MCFSNDPQVKLMRETFKPQAVVPAALPDTAALPTQLEMSSAVHNQARQLVEPFVKVSDGFYPSDADNELEEWDIVVDPAQRRQAFHCVGPRRFMCQSPSDLEMEMDCFPAHKLCILDVPYHVEQVKQREERFTSLQMALQDLNKQLKSTQTRFIGGSCGLQAHHALAIQAHLDLVVCNR